MPAVLVAGAAVSFAPATPSRADTPVVQNPSIDPQPGPVVIDVSNGPVLSRPIQSPTRFSDLDRFSGESPEPDLVSEREGLPEGLVQVGGMVMPRAMLDGARMVPDANASAFTGGSPAQANETPHWGPEHCEYPDEVPLGIYDYPPKPGMERPRFGTIFLNYNGGVLHTKDPDMNKHVGGENSAENISSIARSGHMFPPYSGGEARAIAVAQAVQVDFEDWAIRVVYLERPPKILPYTMVMIGGHHSDTTAGSSGGVAPIDCEDFGQRNVCYAFQNTQPSTSQANIVSQEVAHTYGLGHTRAPDSVMAFGYAPTQGGDLGFNDSCADTVTVSGQAGACTGVNRCHCGVPDQQHDKRTIGMIFAPAGPDLVEPTIEFLAPDDGQIFEPGEPIVLELDPWDDVGGYGWKIEVETEAGELLAEQVDYQRVRTFTLTGFDPGTYVLRATIQDHADHVGMHEIVVEVRAPEGHDANDDDGASDDGASDDGVEGTTGLEETTGVGDDGDAGDSAGLADDDGCGCSTPSMRGTAPWSSAGLLLLGLAAVRRRRAPRIT
jgi:MYXO-CTERM domain-containing protein